MHSASYPVAAARSIMLRTRPRSFHTYTWNQLRPPAPASATSSMERVPSVDRAYGMFQRAATLATDSSPGGSTIRVKPVGARIRGNGISRPSSTEEVSILLTSRNTAGENSQLWKSCWFRP